MDRRLLARRGDVVVVTIHYRLGYLGFLPLLDVVAGKLRRSCGSTARKEACGGPRCRGARMKLGNINYNCRAIKPTRRP
jgi:hypothetical protein